MKKFSLLVAARKNSKYLAKFLFGYLENTAKKSDIEVLVMLNKEDTWNQELVKYFDGLYNIKFYYEDKKLGRAGLHEYLNELYDHSDGRWIVYFCEDHFISMPGWDTAIRKKIAEQSLNGVRDIWCLVPKFDNAGAMNHILSRGFVECMGGYLSRHGNLDSYLNQVTDKLSQNRKILLDDEMFHDFTHDKPGPMSDAHLQSQMTDEARKMPKFGGGTVESMIDEDVEKLDKHLELRNELRR